MAGFYAKGNNSQSTSKAKKKGFYALNNADTQNTLEYDGIKFGTVTDRGLKAIQNNTLDSYTPATEEEKRAIRSYTAYKTNKETKAEEEKNKNGASALLGTNDKIAGYITDKYPLAVPTNPSSPKEETKTETTEDKYLVSNYTKEPVKVKVGNTLPDFAQMHNTAFGDVKVDTTPNATDTHVGNWMYKSILKRYGIDENEFDINDFDQWARKHNFEPVTNDKNYVTSYKPKKNATSQEKSDYQTLWSIATSNSKRNHEENADKTVFQLGAFKDGYDFGDATKATLSTVADAGLGVTKGVFRLVEGLVDLGAYGLYGASKLVGADKFANRVKAEAQADSTNLMFGGADKYLDENSLLGYYSDAVAEGLGYVGGIMLTANIGGAVGLGTKGVSALTTAVTGTSSMGSGMGEAYQGGATDGQAVSYGAMKGVIDAGTELLFGGLSKTVKAVGINKGIGGLDDIFAKKLSNKLVSKIANENVQRFLGNTIEYTVKGLGEGTEEWLAGLGSAVAKKLTYKSETELKQLIEDENLLEQFVIGSIISYISQSPDFVKAIKSNTDFVTGFTKAEELDINQAYETLIAEVENSGKKLTKKDKVKIYDKVVENAQGIKIASLLVTAMSEEAKANNASDTETTTTVTTPTETPTTIKVEETTPATNGITSTVNVGDVFTDTKNGDTIKIIGRDDTMTTMEFTDKDGNVAVSEFSNNSADAMGTNSRYKRTVETSKSVTTPTTKGITSAYTNNNQKIDMQYKVVSADDLIVSNNIDGTVNPNYPQEYQPRERTRQASILQVQNIAKNVVPEKLGESANVSDGAPIVGSDNVVESGNGRTMALSLMYKTNPEGAKKYIEYIKANADKFGIDANNLPNNPVLVRERLTEVDRAEFVKQANESSLGAMSATELAKTDAERLTGNILSLLVANDDGNINTPDNKAFVGRVISEVFSKNDLNSVVGANGMLSANGLERIRNAMFYKAYNDVSLASKLSESLDNDIKNITNVLVNIAPKIVQIKNGIANGTLYDLDFSQDIVDGINYLQEAKRQDLKVRDFAKQITIGEDVSNVVKFIALFFEQKNRGAKQATLFFNHLCDTILSKDPNQIGFLNEDTKTPTKEEIVNEAINRYNNDEQGTGINYSEMFVSQRSEESRQAVDTRGIGDNIESVTEQRPVDSESNGTSEQHGYVEEETAPTGNVDTQRQGERGTEERRPANRTDEAEVGAGELSYDDFTLDKVKHTATNEDIWVIRPKERVDDFAELKEKMKSLGGYYSRFATTPNGKGGFVFKENPAHLFGETNAVIDNEQIVSAETPTQNAQNTPKSNETKSGKETPTETENIATEPNLSDTKAKKKEVVTANKEDNASSDKKTSKKPKTKEQANTKVVETTTKLDDFGEKIGGARKDQWSSRGLLTGDLDEMNEREREKNVKKDNVWKRPNYQKLIESGRDRGLLWAVNETRKSLNQNIYYGYKATEETKAEKQKEFIETIREIQSMAENAKTKSDLEAMGEKWLIDNGYLEDTGRSYSRYVYTKKFSDNPALAGTNYLSNIRYLAKNFENLTTLADRNQFAVDTKSQVPKGFSIVGGEGSVGGKLVDGEWVKDESYSVAKGRMIIQSGFATREEALAWLKQGLAKKKSKTRFVPQQLLEVHRKGADYRDSKSVDGQNYVDTFGFKGGEFGNWMSAKDRQVSLDYGFDALKDLADALNIEDTDISFGGNLNIAFGARGQGLSSASAHYENMRRVINLTKMNGAGSLAHEWFHALDDFVGGYSNNFATDKYRSLPEKTKGAISDLITAMRYKDATQEETDLVRQHAYDKAIKSVTYQVKKQFGWVEKFENGTLLEGDTKYFKRTPTQDDVDKYHSLLTALSETGDAKYIDELSNLRKEVRGHVISKEDRDNLSFRLYALKPSAKEGVQLSRKATDFFNNSVKFGQLHSKDGDYWDSTIEMSARAFACYVADKTNKQNDYLSAHSDSAVTLDMDKDGNPVIVRAFPVGEERATINSAFDKLIEALKSDGFLHEKKHTENKPKEISYSISNDTHQTNNLSEESEDFANEPERNSLLSGDSRRTGDESTREQVEGLSETERKRTAEEIISKGHTEEKVVGKVKLNFVKAEAYNDDMKSIIKSNEEKGLNTHFFLGNGVYKWDAQKRILVDGMIDGNDVYLRYDGKFTPQTLNLHENVHSTWDTEKTQKAKDKIWNSLSEAEQNAILNEERYKKYTEMYDGDTEMAKQEFVADVLAGMSTYTSRNTDTVNNYWSNSEIVDNFKVSEYTHSTDAGGTRATLNGSKIIPSGETLIDKISPKEYNARGWSYGLFSTEDLRLLNERWKSVLSKNYKNKTPDGLSVIKINNKVIFASGTYNNPVVESVIVYNASDENELIIVEGIITEGDKYGNFNRTRREELATLEEYLQEEKLFVFRNRKDYQSPNKGIGEDGARRAVQPRGFRNFGYVGSYEFRDGVFIQDEGEVSEGTGTSYGRGYSLSNYANTFYSYMAKVVDGIKQAKLGADSVVNMLRGKGVKSEEIKWSGIESWLEGKKSVTKEELQEFVAGSMLQIEETTLDDNDIPYTQEQTEKINEYESQRNEIVEKLKDEWKKSIGTDLTLYNFANVESKVVDLLLDADAQIKKSTEAGKEMDEAKKQLRDMFANDDFGYDSEHQAYMYASRNPEDFMQSFDLTEKEQAIFERFIRAKEAFKSVEGISKATQRHLLDIASSADTISRKINAIEVEHDLENSKHKPKWGEYKLDGGSNYRELVFKMPNSTYSNNAMRTHWGGEAEGVLAHARVQDIETKNGKMLFIEEIQSDWHNEGRTEGYSDEKKAEALRLEERNLKKKNRVERESIVESLSKLMEGKVDEPQVASKTIIDFAHQNSPMWEYEIKRFNIPVELVERVNNLSKDRQKAIQLSSEAYQLEQGIPDAPFKDNYHEYVLKRLIRMAVENGYDSIGWTTADIQSERWSEQYSEGYRIEYDQEIPKFLNKYGKKWGAKVGKDYVRTNEFRVTDLEERLEDIERDIEQYNDELADNPTEEYEIFIRDGLDDLNKTAEEIRKKLRGTEVWSMSIPESMSDSVLYEGQPMYSLSAESDDSTLDVHYSKSTEDMEAKWDEALEKYGAIQKGEKPVRDIDVPRKRNSNEPISWFGRTALEAGITPNEVVDDFKREIMFGKMAHEVITDKKSEEKAIAKITRLGFEEAVKDWDTLVSNNKINKEDFVFGMVLYNQAVTNKDYKLAMKLISDLTVEASQSAQVLQSVRMLKKMSPDGTLYYLEKSVEKMNEEFKEQLGDNFKDIEIDSELMKELYEAETAEERDEAIEKIEQNIADQIPSSLSDKWNAWRYLAMLGNIRTHGRNIFGNMSNWVVRRVKNLLGAVLEKTIPAEQRTKSLTKSKESVAFAKEDAEVMRDILTGTGGKYEMANKIQQKRTIFKTKWLELIRRGNFDFLEAEDWWFLKDAYQDSLAQLITARHLDIEFLKSGTTEANEILNRVRAYAINEAKVATFRQASELGKLINRTKREFSKSDKWYGKVGGALIEGVMPFTNVPINIAKQGVAYSPIGFVKGMKEALSDVKKGKKTASEAIDTLSKGLTGTAIVALGAFLKAMGLIVAEPDDDDKKKDYDRMRGHQSYALVIGDHSYTIDWLTPISLPLFVGVEIQNLASDEGLSGWDVVNALTRLVDPMIELSVLQGVSDALDNAKRAGESPLVAVLMGIITSYFGQALPTLGGQIARLIDNEQRTYYIEKGEGFLSGQIKKFVQVSAKKIPFASKLLEPQIDAWGEKKTYGSVVERIIESTISPGYYSKITTTEVDEELHRLFEATGDNAVYPNSNTVKSFKENKKTYNLTAEQSREFAEVRGKKSLERIEKLFSKEKYDTRWDDKKKLEKIKEAYDKAYDDAKEYILDKYFSE